MSEEKNDEEMEELEISDDIEETIEDAKEEELTVPEIPLEVEEEEEFTIPEVPIEAEIEEDEEEFAVPEIPLETESEEEKPIDTEENDELEIPELEAEEETEKIRKPKKKRQKSPALWIGLAIGLGIAIIAEVLFTIPAWLYDTSSPDLFYIELVVILIAMMIPGLVSRSIQKGLLGATIIFVITFGLPFLMMAFNVVLLNPLTPLFSSTDFALSALDVFSDLFEIPFDVAAIQKWIWVIDLVLMFLLMVIVVTIAAALIKNITLPKKKVGNWIGIPLLSLGLIIFAIFTPIIFSSTYGVIQASTSFLAGTSKLNTAYGLFETDINDPQQLDVEIGPVLTEASYWFNISQRNYQGLRNIGLISFAVLVSGQYGPLIEAGDQLALATLSFTQVLYPLFSGVFTLTNSLNNATDSLAGFGQSGGTSYFTKGLNDIKINDESDIEELKASLIESINGMDRAQESLDKVLIALQEADVSGSFDEVEAILDDLDYDRLPTKLADIILLIKDNLGLFKGQLDGFETLINYTSEALSPTKDLLWIAYYTIVGNDYLKKYNFEVALDAYTNATDIIETIDDIPTFTPGSGLEDIFAITITDNFSVLLEDLLALMDPLLNEQRYFAKTYIEITKMVQIFETSNNDITTVNYVLNPLPAILANASQTAIYGALANTELTSFRGHILAGDYGSAFNDIGVSFDKILTDDFKPQEFADYTVFLANSLDYFWKGCEEFKLDHMTDAIGNLTIASDTLNNNVIAVFNREELPDYFEIYLDAWSTAFNNIKTSMDTEIRPDAINTIYDILNILQTDIAEKL
ncbi:MAG: hypothetical protein EAX90_02805 [Candidatus Heimdallarchaeota archaeon]|nr:hypothetical protein [Candidatus Heimdallarchaeota archaeon]